MLRLYELPERFRALDAALDVSGGELTLEQEGELTALIEAEEKGLETFHRAIVDLRAYEEAVGREIERLREVRGKAKARLETYAGRIQRYMTSRELAKVPTSVGVLALRQGPPKVEVDCDPESLPESFLKRTVEVRKREILDAYKQGETLPPGITVTRGEVFSY